MKGKEHEKIKTFVLEKYRSIASPGTSPDHTSSSCQSCCSSKENSATEIAAALGYSEKELVVVPEGANLGLGCGNPQVIADLQQGEVVLDLGSGGGFDCFLAARQVGPEGLVIGVDMTAEMIGLARQNAAKSGLDNVSFRLGELEHLPVADGSVDVVMSNCVINLTTDKEAVYREAFRVLKPGGRLAISDVVATREIPAEMREDLELWSSCVSGAALISELEEILSKVGFARTRIDLDEGGREVIKRCAPGHDAENYVAPARIVAGKP
jgi:SAM-dependent methyltransferase